MKHVAGEAVTPDGDLVIQRCMVCGYAIVKIRCSESRVATMDGKECGVATFKVGDIVDVEGQNPVRSRLVGTTERPDEIKDIKGLCMG